MAKVTLNAALAGLSGTSGNLVFRRVGDQTIAARRPEAGAKAPSPSQLAQRERFRRAGEYAQQVLADPWQRKAYERLAAGQPVWRNPTQTDIPRKNRCRSRI